MLPIENIVGIPVENHPGAFGVRRKHDIHTGVDLYCQKNTTVYSMENGIVIHIAPFTGASMGYPWWLETSAVMVRLQSGIVVLYGEIVPAANLKVGSLVNTGVVIGYVTPVLPPEKLRTDIPGHSVNMLHLEMWKDSTWPIKWEGWELNEPRNERIINPTYYLMHQWEVNKKSPCPILYYGKEEYPS